MELKLNKKRTYTIGIAFFTILLMWQIYNSYCPLILKKLLIDNWGPSGNGGSGYDYIIGIIMALDNIFALFMLPLFGRLSDRTHTRLGKRMPYILIGTLIVVALFPFIPILYLHNSLLGVCIMMVLVIIAMSIYRNPAVSLMPDMTPKPLRSRANAIINLLGYLGAIVAGVVSIFFSINNSSIVVPFIITSIMMLLALIILMTNIKENDIAKQMTQEMKLGEEYCEASGIISEDEPLCNKDKINLRLIIITVFLTFFAFNAIETFWTTYCEFYLGISKWMVPTIVMTVCSMLTFIPSGKLTERFGRKHIVLCGLIMMIASLGGCAVLSRFMPKMAGYIPWQFYGMIVLFGVAGSGWALVNVNFYPMVLEMAHSNDIGKYTGYYYASSMLAEAITPAIIGFVMSLLTYRLFFLYAILFMTIASIIFCFVQTKNTKLKS